MKLPLLIAAYLCLFIFGFIETSRGPIYPDILANWSLPKSSGAIFFAIASLAGLAVNLCGRWWMPYVGSWRSLQGFSLFLAISCWGMGWAAEKSYATFLFFAALFGMTVGGLGIAINLLTVQASPVSHRARALQALANELDLIAD